MHRVFSLSLRASALITRFIFFLALAKFLSPEQVGLFGLVAATVSYGIYVLGMDFYIFSNREIKITSENEKPVLIKQSFAFYIAMYIILIPALFCIFLAGLLPSSLIYMFFAVLIFEHLGQEAYRFLIILERPLLASFSLFLRLGLWAIVIGVLMALDTSFRTLDAILIAWAIGGASAVLVSAVVFAQLPRGGWKNEIDLQWIRRGVRVALPFMIGTLCLRGIVTVDRYWLEALTNRELLGVYTFFLGMVSTLPALLEAGVLAFLSPGLISAAHKGDSGEYQRLFHLIRRDTCIAVAGFAVAASAGIHVVLLLIDQPIYADNISYFYICLAALSFFALSSIYQTGLYAHRADQAIITSHIVALVVFASATACISVFSPYFAVPGGLLIAYIGVLVTKVRSYRSVTAALGVGAERAPYR